MNPVLRRARPLLGTLVEMRVEGLREADARAALTQAFAEVGRVHALMSFHAPDSDLSRVHAAHAGAEIEVDARTHEVLTIARLVADLTGGAFDVAVGAALVNAGALPRPRSPFTPDPAARAGDIELLAGNRVRLRRPLWIDVGGIAKGYAVDRAVELLQVRGATQICVNAGGDLRCFGPRAEGVHLRAGDGALPSRPTLELRDAAIATSATQAAGVHRHGATQAEVAPGLCASVAAARCVIADALTKVVLASDARTSARALAHFGAQAARHDPRSGWIRLENAA
ncbi:MAG TPA: FAD:protein FMN transferase [Rudaea sp.]|nr:FAD:protein FMN transferase [Rudaea sp.]